MHFIIKLLSVFQYKKKQVFYCNVQTICTRIRTRKLTVTLEVQPNQSHCRIEFKTPENTDVPRFILCFFLYVVPTISSKEIEDRFI